MVQPSLLTLYSWLSVNNDHWTLRHLGRVLAKTNAAHAECERAINFCPHVGNDPANHQTWTWDQPDNERTSDDQKLIGRECSGRASHLYSRISRDNLNGPAVRTHEN